MVSVIVMSDDVQKTSDVRPKDKARNSPKHSKEVWLKVRTEYESGTYSSLKELAERYHINIDTLRSKVFREEWSIKKAILLNKVQQRVEEKTVDRVSGYLSRLTLRAEKYEKLLDQTIDQIGGPVEPGDLDTLTRSELRVVEMNKVGLRIAPPSVDITSKGLSVGESIVTAIEKLRANPSAIVHVSSEQVDRVLEMEVVDDPPKA